MPDDSDGIPRLAYSANRARRFSLRSTVYLGETLSRIDAETRALYYKWNVAAVPEVVVEQRAEN